MSTSLFDCQQCGACCAYSADWPVLIGEGDGAELPARFVDRTRGAMRCDGDRCTALAGAIGGRVRCTVYAYRPLVCRELQAGDDDCIAARNKHGLSTAPPGLAGDQPPR